MTLSGGFEPAALVSFLEGPACGPGGVVYFSDVVGSRLHALDPDGSVRLFRADSGRANGNVFDPAGRLITCEGGEFGPGGRRQITSTDLATGEVEVVTDRFEGHRYNSPNDVTVDPDGRIYFTDPRFGQRGDLELGVEGVYRVDVDRSVQRILGQVEVQRPNGIAVTPDGRTLYVVDSNYDVGGRRCIWSFDIAPDGRASAQRLVYSWAPGRGADGIELDRDGNIYAAAGIARPRGPGETMDHPPGIYVVRPDGRLLDVIPVPQDVVTNLCFGGPSYGTLYATAGNTLFRIELGVRGYHAYDPA